MNSSRIFLLQVYKLAVVYTILWCESLATNLYTLYEQALVSTKVLPQWDSLFKEKELVIYFQQNLVGKVHFKINAGRKNKLQQL